MTVDVQRGRGRVQHHDDRSRAFAASALAVPTYSWIHKMGPVLDQGQIGGCTGWSGADWLNSAQAAAHRRLYNVARQRGHGTAFLTNDDGLWLYEQATQRDNLGWTYPPTDNGSTGLGVMKALVAVGALTKYLWTFDFSTMLGWAQKQVVMLGTLWTDAMMEPDTEGILHIGSQGVIDKAVKDGEGHEYCLIGGDMKRGLARIRNHWTASWGLSGDAWIPFDQLETLVIQYQGDVAVPEVIPE